MILVPSVQTECEFTVMPCKFKNVGCDFKSKRDTISAHEQDSKLHLHMAVDTVAKLQERVEMLAWPEIDAEASTTFELTEYEEKRDYNQKFVFPFYSSKGGYSMAICMHVNGDDNVDMVFGTRDYDEKDDFCFCAQSDDSCFCQSVFLLRVILMKTLLRMKKSILMKVHTSTTTVTTAILLM